MRQVCTRFLLVIVQLLVTGAVVPVVGQDSWKLEKENGNIKVYTAPVKGSKIRQFKVTASFRGKLATAEQLFRNLSGMSDWYEGVREARLTRRISDNEAEYLLIYKMPFPMKDRVATIRGRIKTGERQIFVDTADFPGTIPHSEKDLVHVLKMWSTWEITSKSDGMLYVTHTGFMDPTGPVPDWLINMKLTDVPIKTVTNLGRMLESGKI